MSEQIKKEDNLDFVVSHFRDGYLLPVSGWRRFIMTHRQSRSWRKLAAASIAGVVLIASASILYFEISTPSPDQPVDESLTVPAENIISISENKVGRIEFHDAPLKEVTAEIERVYGVKISNLPKEELLLTISYEGTADDVIETINELMNINLKIESREDLSVEP